MASEKHINEAKGDECWVMKAVLYSENGTRRERGEKNGLHQEPRRKY